MKLKILPCVIGLGYVGLPVLIRLKKKFIVKGFDINSKRIQLLNKHIDYNNEYKSNELRLKKGSIYTDQIKKIKDSNFYIIAVPTPIKRNFEPDLKYVKIACTLISKILKRNDIIFLESTIYPGVTEEICSKLIEKKSNLKAGKDFYIGYSSERINPGDKKHNIHNINKVVAINANKTTREIVLKVYKTISKKIIFTKNIKEAELSKLMENTQRDLNISLMNELMIICHKAKINFFNSLKLAKSKWNFLNFYPGLVGGHCLPVDPFYLSYFSKKIAANAQVTLAGRKINDSMKNFIFKIIKNKILKYKNNKILILGVSYKKNVSDHRNSLALEIALKLRKIFSNITIYDPYFRKDLLKKYHIRNKINNFTKYKVSIFLTNHKDFTKLHSNFKKNNKIIIDLFNYYN
jgi:UDP-N-acetyl-D-galactosamine dehydrogenase